MSIDDIKESGTYGSFESISMLFSNFGDGSLTSLMLFMLVSASFIFSFSIIGIFGTSIMRSKIKSQGEIDEETLEEKLDTQYIKSSLFLSLILSCILVPTALMLSPKLVNNLKYTHQILKPWTEGDVSTYLNQLPEKNKDIQAVSRMLHSKESHFNSHYFESVDKELLVPVSIVYADEKNVGKELNTRAFVKFDLKADDRPYMSYKKLEYDLGHELVPGIYNVTLHLPFGYHFNQ